MLGSLKTYHISIPGLEWSEAISIIICEDAKIARGVQPHLMKTARVIVQVREMLDDLPDSYQSMVLE
jgi:hypothetical protein